HILQIRRLPWSARRYHRLFDEHVVGTAIWLHERSSHESVIGAFVGLCLVIPIVERLLLDVRQYKNGPGRPALRAAASAIRHSAGGKRAKGVVMIVQGN